MIEPIETASLYYPLFGELIPLLSGLAPNDWSRRTVCSRWTVKDIALHLLDVDIRRLSFARDGADIPKPDTAIESYSDLVKFLNRLNADWVSAGQRISSQLLIELLGLTGPLVASHVASLDMQAAARFSVAWAGEEVSLNWFDVARDYTERWHHQKQIRDAAGAAGLTSHYWMHPVLATFMRALPHVYRDTRSQNGDAVEIRIEGDAGGIWSLTHSGGAWDLSAKTADLPLSTVVLDQDIAWRLFTKGIAPDQARSRIRIEGSQQLGSPFLNTIAVMA